MPKVRNRVTATANPHSHHSRPSIWLMRGRRSIMLADGACLFILLEPIQLPLTHENLTPRMREGYCDGTPSIKLTGCAQQGKERKSVPRCSFRHNANNGCLIRHLRLSHSCKMLRSTGGMRRNSQPAAPYCLVHKTRASM